MLAHVDAGKTTLSESILYLTGAIRKMGRVDHQDAFLDTDAMERARGITIFSKQAEFVLRRGGDEKAVTLLDTPGHVDFSAEMERTLSVLDYAVLVISGADGVQGHTVTLWRLLEQYHVPVFLFINKMDQAGTDREKLMEELKRDLSDACIDFGADPAVLHEDLAMYDEQMMERFLSGALLQPEEISMLIRKRQVFPCFFGSALKVFGVEELLDALCLYTRMPKYPAGFAAKVYKITRDARGQRLTHMKITGGQLRVKDILPAKKNINSEKVNQIRIYSGEKFTAVDVAESGTICAVTGISFALPGDGLGTESDR